MANLVLLQKILQPHLGENIFCSVYASTRARQPRISISYNEGVRIIVPARIRNRDRVVGHILTLRKDWIMRHWRKISSIKKEHLDIPDLLEFEGRVFAKNEIKVYAKKRISKRVNELAGIIGAQFNKIYIRNQKRCWGSCSRRRNLSFNWRLVLLKDALMDYVILHELTHLKHFNHSKEFWCELENIYPGAKRYNKELKRYEY